MGHYVLNIVTPPAVPFAIEDHMRNCGLALVKLIGRFKSDRPD
jgi:hypothetical protein